MRQKAKKLLHLNPKTLEILVGILIAAKGFWLYLDRTYFFFPPQFKDLMNAPFIDATFMVVGLLLFLLAIIPSKLGIARDIDIGGHKIRFNSWSVKTNLIKVCLVICGCFMLALALLAVTHGMFTPEYRMGHTALADSFIFIVIVLTAGDA